MVLARTISAWYDFVRGLSSPRRMNVTCYADASWSKKTGGAWAVWLRSDAGRLVRGGQCPSYVKGSAQAELAAIFAGMFLAVRHWGAEVGSILICSDCVSALDAIDPEAPLSKRKDVRRLQGRVRALVQEHGLRVETRHVRGHQDPDKNTPSFLNTQCDRIANRTRRALYEQSPAARRRRRRKQA